MTELITEGVRLCQQFVRNRSHIVLANKRERRPSRLQAAVLGDFENERGPACLPLLEGSSVEEPDRQSADRDDAEKDQDEGDVRLSLRIVLSEAVQFETPSYPAKPVELRGIEPLTS